MGFTILRAAKSVRNPAWPERPISVLQGQHVISDRPDHVLTTGLGSCVAACVFDRVSGIGGMNHFLLPYAGSGNGDIRFAAAAMEILVNGLLWRGASRAGLQAKLFGGAHMTACLPDIGSLNARAAHTFLEDEGISLVTSHLGGTSARRIHFWPISGRVTLRLLKAAPSPEAPTHPVAGEIILF